MIPAGRRDTSVVFERAATVRDAHGGDVSTWSPVARALAAVRFGTSAERREAAAENASQAATFRVLATPSTRTLVVTDRLAALGSAWDIEGIAPVTRGEIEITAVRSRS